MNRTTNSETIFFLDAIITEESMGNDILTKFKTSRHARQNVTFIKKFTDINESLNH